MNCTNDVTLYIDPPSHHFTRDRLFQVDNRHLNGDQIMAPYAYLQELLASRGIEVHTADYMPEREDGKRHVYVSMGRMADHRALAQRQDVVLSAFFAMECPIADPSLYRALKGIEQQFKRIYSWSDGPSLEHFVGGRLSCLPFKWPQSFDDVHEPIWRRTDRKFLVMINANKLPRIYWQELYTERLRAIEFFGRTGEIDLYGKGWDVPSFRVGGTWKPYTFRREHRALLQRWQQLRPDPMLEAARRVYRGPAASKAETLGGYRFAICFENMVLKGWITEKIFDCFFAGTVPVYWGSPDIQEHVPPECFIDMRRFDGYSDLARYLKSLSEADVRRYKENARDFLRSPRFYPFSKQAFAELFLRIVEEDAGVPVGA